MSPEITSVEVLKFVHYSLNSTPQNYAWRNEDNKRGGLSSLVLQDSWVPHPVSRVEEEWEESLWTLVSCHVPAVRRTW